MGAQKVQGRIERIMRIVLIELLEACCRLVGIDLVQEEVEHGSPEGIVHRRVELAAQKVVPRLAVGNLVRGIFPDLADDSGIGTLCACSRGDVADEVFGELICHIEPPATGTKAQPMADDAVLAADELVVARVLFADVRQVAYAPPGGILARVVYLVPGAVRRVLALEGANLGIVVVLVEVARIAARMVEDAVEHYCHAMRLRSAAELLEGLRVAEHRVDLHVVGRVIAVVRGSLEDRVQIEHCDAQRLEIVELLCDAGKRAAVEVPGHDIARGILLVAGLGVPVLDKAASRAIPLDRECRIDTLAPVGAACEAVREDLVDDAFRVPQRKRLPREVDRDLPARRLIPHKLAFARRGAVLRAIPADGAIGAIDLEVVPEDLRIRHLEGAGEVQVVSCLLAVHVIDVLAFAIHPGADIG